MADESKPAEEVKAQENQNQSEPVQQTENVQSNTEQKVAEVADDQNDFVEKPASVIAAEGVKPDEPTRNEQLSFSGGNDQINAVQSEAINGQQQPDQNMTVEKVQDASFASPPETQV